MGKTTEVTKKAGNQYATGMEIDERAKRRRGTAGGNEGDDDGEQGNKKTVSGMRAEVKPESHTRRRNSDRTPKEGMAKRRSMRRRKARRKRRLQDKSTAR